MTNESESSSSSDLRELESITPPEIYKELQKGVLGQGNALSGRPDGSQGELFTTVPIRPNRAQNGITAGVLGPDRVRRSSVPAPVQKGPLGHWPWSGRRPVRLARSGGGCISWGVGREEHVRGKSR